MVEIEQHSCLRCDHRWWPRITNGKPNKPKQCPKCHSTKWDTPKKKV